MKKTKRSKHILRNIALLLLFAILVVGAVLVFRFTGGMNEDFKMYYLRYGNESILNERSEMQFNSNNDYRFDVVNTFGSLQGDVVFDVAVKANSEVNFEYTVNGETKSWNDPTLDFTEYFVTKNDKSFTFNSEIKSIDELMRLVYPEAEVVLPSKLNTTIYPFDLIVSSSGSNTVFHIKFCFANFIEFDPPSVVF